MNHRRHSQQSATEFQAGGSLGVGHETEVPDTGKTFRQYVQQKSASELFGGNGHLALLIATSVVPPAERDVIVVKGEQSMIGDGDAVGVASEIAENLFRSTECRFRVDDPVSPE